MIREIRRAITDSAVDGTVVELPWSEEFKAELLSHCSYSEYTTNSHTFCGETEVVLDDSSRITVERYVVRLVK